MKITLNQNELKDLVIDHLGEKYDLEAKPHNVRFNLDVAELQTNDVKCEIEINECEKEKPDEDKG